MHKHFNLNKHIKLSQIPTGNVPQQFNVNTPEGKGVPISGGNNAQVEDNSEKLKNIISQIITLSRSGNNQAVSNVAALISNDMIPQDVNSNIRNEIIALSKRASEDPNSTTMNLDTGEEERSLGDIAESIANQMSYSDPEWSIEKLLSSNNQKIASIIESQKEKDEDEDEASEKRKDKKKRGNPFRVLMGLVGKMLSRGMSKKDIVNKIIRRKNNYWERNTVSNCVDIVKEYERKKERKKKSKASSSFNLRKYSQRQLDIRGNVEPRPSLYDVPRDLALMSSTELLMRHLYLDSAKRFDTFGSTENVINSDPINKVQVKADLKKVNEELKRRGFDDSDRELFNQIIETPQKTKEDKK